MVKRLETRSPLNVQKPSAAYLQALRLFWRGEKEGALAIITDALAESAAPTAPLYRLWVEILAEDFDERALGLLQDHLNRTIDFKHPSWVAQFALVGIVHYELGNVEAAQIIARSMRRHAANAYYKELQLVLSPDLSDTSALAASRSLIKSSSDYFHFRRASLLMHQQDRGQSLRRTLDEVMTLFGNAPLRAEIGFHDAFGAKNYRQAWLFAKRLRSDFPTHSGYQFFYAYTSFVIERNRLALHEFLQLNRRFQAADPDVLCMLGLTLLQSPEPISAAQKNRSRSYLAKAKLRLQAMGYPSAYPQELINRLDERETVTSNRIWIVKLSAKQCLDLYQRPLARIDLLHRAMGEAVKQGDHCFFVSENAAKSDDAISKFRLVALYKAASNPEWHPTHRWQTALKLQLRLEVGIPFEVAKKQLLPTPMQAQRYGLIEISRELMLTIEDSIRSFTLDDHHYSHIIDDLKDVGSL